MKKLFALVMALVFVAVVAAGCSGEPEPSSVIDMTEPTPTPGVAETTPEPSMPELPTADGSPMVAAGDWHLVALCADGTVLAAGDNSLGQCDVDEWKDIVAIGAAGKTTAALSKDGKVLLTGELAEGAWADAANWTGIVNMLVEKTTLAGLKDDGTIVTVGDETPLTQESFETAAADGVENSNFSATINADGTITTEGRYEDLGWLVKNWNLQAGTLSAGRPEAADPNAEKMEKAQKTNSDVIGYIRINNTMIDFPVLWDDWSDGTWFYNDHDINKQKTGNPGAGSVYALTSNKKLKINTITGHNMRVSATMMHDLHHVQEFNTGFTKCQGKDCGTTLPTTLPKLTEYGDRVWNITAYGYTRWEVFAMYEVKKDEPDDTIYYNTNLVGSSDGKEDQWINYQLSRSEIDLGITPTTDDTFLVIYTCGTEYDSSTAQSRLYYFLRAVE